MATVYIKVIGHSFEFDVINTALLFWPGSKISQNDPRASACRIYSEAKSLPNGKTLFRARVYWNQKTARSQKTVRIVHEREALRPIKQTLFSAAHKATGLQPPWGILTGIRPMHIYENISAEHSPESTERILRDDYFLQQRKRQLLSEIAAFRVPAYYSGVQNDLSLYVSIPFCPSKCKYCSFVSSSVEKSQKLLQPYFELLLKETADKLSCVRESGKTISTVYVGGGTPGVLTAEQMEALLSLIADSKLRELCFEIGRPETVTAEKLAVLKRFGVNRVCINTQTTQDDVLQTIGRRHTAAEFFDAFRLAKSFAFQTINVDLIAGLPNESVKSHLDSVRKMIELGAENITIHTLSIKRANTWENDRELFDPQASDVNTMLEKGRDMLKNAGYGPYYIYRQKSTLSNGENVGYAKSGHIGLYNIYMMEDVHTVIGCGAGASTKIFDPATGRIDRIYNMKYPLDYLQNSGKLTDNFKALAAYLKGTADG